MLQVLIGVSVEGVDWGSVLQVLIGEVVSVASVGWGGCHCCKC